MTARECWMRWYDPESHAFESILSVQYDLSSKAVTYVVLDPWYDTQLPAEIPESRGRNLDVRR